MIAKRGLVFVLVCSLVLGIFPGLSMAQAPETPTENTLDWTPGTEMLCDDGTRLLMDGRASATTGAAMPDPVPDEVISGYFLFEARGHQISASEAVASVQNWVDAAGLPAETEVEFLPLDHSSPVLVSGDEILISYGNGFSTRYAAVIRGDVTGTGKTGLVQLVALARLFSSEIDDELKKLAADVNGDGSVTISDLVRLAADMLEANPAGPVLSSAPQIFPRRSSNAFAENYGRWSSPVKSHVYENPSGGLTRVEYIDGRLVVEDYDPDFTLLFTRSAAVELPIWGGFFCGEDYNYVVYGQTNREERDTTEVIRIVKYDKSWNRLAAGSLFGANTIIPFEAGSLRCDEYGGCLYIRTCHEMYATSDGLNHQANLMMDIRESDMQITEAFYGIASLSYGYVSHSFNQFIKISRDGAILTMDHGDAYPRGGVLLMYRLAAGQPLFLKPNTYDQTSGVVFQKFAGEVGDNTTGASLGGFELTGEGVICAYNYDGIGDGGPREVYACRANTTSGSYEIQQLTHGANATTPQAASLGDGTGYVMWVDRADQDSPKFCYTTYGTDGKVGTVRDAEAESSDCNPIAWKRGVVWYVTKQGSEPVFYTLSNSGVTGTSASAGLQQVPGA